MLFLPATLPPSPQATHQRTVLAMGTQLTIQIPGPQAQESALQEVARLESWASTWQPESRWSALNQAQGAPMVMDQESLDLFATVKAWQQKIPTFDPVLGALTRAWGLRTGGRTPTPAEVRAALEASGARLLEVDLVQHQVRLGHPQAALDEGGFLKGHALDRLRHVAQGKGASAGWADFGGQVLAWGRPIPVHIAAPKNRHRALCSLKLRDASLATSGCSERGTHILDPRTGQPVPDWGSVSVVAPTGLEADILSTALFVLGPKEGLTWATKHHVAALFLTHAGPCRMSPRFHALRPLFHER